MRQNVALCSTTVIAPKGVANAVDDPRHPFRPRHLRQGRAVAHEQIEQLHGIGARPLARCPPLITADRP